jgi:hypothetical protein
MIIRSKMRIIVLDNDIAKNTLPDLIKPKEN